MAEQCTPKNKRRRNNTNCCVPQCYSRSSKREGLSFHMFPTDPQLHTLWRLRFKIGKEISRRMVACSKHFKPQDFHPSPSQRSTNRRKNVGLHKRFLKKNAVPSLCLPSWNPKEISTSEDKGYRFRMNLIEAKIHSFTNKLKKRFEVQSEIYEKFLKILDFIKDNYSTYNARVETEVIEEVCNLLQNNEDLIEEFKKAFVPNATFTSAVKEPIYLSRPKEPEKFCTFCCGNKQETLTVPSNKKFIHVKCLEELRRLKADAGNSSENAPIHNKENEGRVIASLFIASTVSPNMEILSAKKDDENLVEDTPNTNDICATDYIKTELIEYDETISSESDTKMKSVALPENSFPTADISKSTSDEEELVNNQCELSDDITNNEASTDSRESMPENAFDIDDIPSTPNDAKECVKRKLQKSEEFYKEAQAMVKLWQEKSTKYKKEITGLQSVLKDLEQISSISDDL